MKTEKNHFGCSIHGVEANTATPAVIAELKEHLYKNRLIVLKDQVVNEQQYCDYSAEERAVHSGFTVHDSFDKIRDRS